MNPKIIIFDLDDTLVNCKMKIPRQTYHMLNKFRKLKYKIGIISYNWMVHLIAKETKLYNYTSYIFYKDIDRDLLFEHCLCQIIMDSDQQENADIYYIDDRLDNLQLIKKKHLHISTYHCSNINELYKFKGILNASI